MAEKNTSQATVITISSTITGIKSNAKLKDLPTKRTPRTMPIATAVEIIVDVNSATSAMLSEFHAALLNFADSKPVNTSHSNVAKNRPND